MKRQAIPVDDFCVRAHHLWATQWLVLTAGDYRAKAFNSMTVGWGSFGTMWGRPFAMVVVRPVRHTYRFMETYPTFTLCAFPETYRPALQILGSKSGRDGDKIAEAGLTPVPASAVEAPAFAEAELVVECRQIYKDRFSPKAFLDAAIDTNYPNRDYHGVTFGEILAVSGTAAYSVSRR